MGRGGRGRLPARGDGLAACEGTLGRLRALLREARRDGAHPGRVSSCEPALAHGQAGTNDVEIETDERHGNSESAAGRVECPCDSRFSDGSAQQDRASALLAVCAASRPRPVTFRDRLAQRARFVVVALRLPPPPTRTRRGNPSRALRGPADATASPLDWQLG